MPTTDRAELLRLLSLARPALATADYIPALTHIQFFDGLVTAYNDVNAIRVAADVGFSACVPGELLIKTLGSLKGDNVAFSLGDKLLVQSARSKINLPVLPTGKFPFEAPANFETTVHLYPEIIDAIAECLISVGNDPKMPQRMGVTLEASEHTGKATLYSTDGVTISKASTDAVIKLPGDSPIILPTFFCEHVVALRKAYPKLPVTMELHPGALLAAFDEEAFVYSKTMVDVEPINFQETLRKFVPPKLNLVPVPDGMDSAIGRAVMVQTGSDKMRTEFSSRTSAGSTSIILSSSGIGDAVDEVDCAADFETFVADPALIARALKTCTHIAFPPKVVALAKRDGSFLHVLAHHAKEK